MTDISRRTFIRLSMLGFATGLTAGCQVSKDTRAQLTGQYGGTDDKILPYVNQPDDFRDGLPQWFATTCRMCPAGCGMIVRTLGGRAVKVEGMPDHPVNDGKMCARGQASLQQMYSPNRLRRPLHRAGIGSRFAEISWDAALTTLAGQITARPGKFAVLADGATYGQSPTISTLLHSLNAPNTPFYFSLIDPAPWREAALEVYGRSEAPLYKIDQADYILAFSANFLESWPSPLYYGRAFGEFRQGARRKPGEHGRFVYVGPRMSMTAAKADEWLPCRPGTEGAVAQGVLTAMGKPGMPVEEAALVSGLTVQQIEQVAASFRAAGERAVALAGDGLVSQANGTRAIVSVESLNAAVGAGLVGFGSAALSGRGSQSSYYAQLERLMTSIKRGDVDSLLIVGQPNPVFATAAASGFADALAAVPFVAALTPFEDETTAHAHLLLPAGTFLEEWSDAVPIVIPGGQDIAGLCQPVIDMKYITTTASSASWMDTRSIPDVLMGLSARIGRSAPAESGEDLVRAHWGLSGSDTWREKAAAGGQWVSVAASPVKIAVKPQQRFTPPKRSSEPGEFTLILYPHIYWTDGRNANVPWLQEITDPMTMAVWNNWVEINLETAHSLGIKTGDIVRLTTDYGSIELPAMPYPAIHPEALAAPIGQGSYDFGGGQTTGHAVANPLSILPPAVDSATGAFAYGTAMVKLEKIRDAIGGYNPDLNTLVILQDRPAGQEPEAVKDLIHTTAQEWRASRAHAVSTP